MDRTALTIRFNEGVREFCEKAYIEYLDLDRESMGKDGLVDTRLLNSDPLDHHYAPCAYMEMMIPKLRDLLIPS
jgi:hypothetical protein